MAEVAVQPTKRKPWARSRVGNGSVLLPMTDGRSLTARRFQDLYEDIAGDLGGLAELSVAERQMVRRVSLLAAETERQEGLWARQYDGREKVEGEPVQSEKFNLELYCMSANCQRRIFGMLGLKRQARDVTSSLASYLQARATAPMIEGEPNE